MGAEGKSKFRKAAVNRQAKSDVNVVKTESMSGV